MGAVADRGELVWSHVLWGVVSGVMLAPIVDGRAATRDGSSIGRAAGMWLEVRILPVPLATKEMRCRLSIQTMVLSDLADFADAGLRRLRDGDSAGDELEQLMGLSTLIMATKEFARRLAPSAACIECNGRGHHGFSTCIRCHGAG